MASKKQNSKRGKKARSSKAKKKPSAKKGGKSGANSAKKGTPTAAKGSARPIRSMRRMGAVEPSSGSEKSSLDPNRSRPLKVEQGGSTVLKGQMSGDVQNLSQEELADSESVEELVQEGQDLEGELVQGIENAPAADQGDVRTHGSPEPDDEPPPYKNHNRL